MARQVCINWNTYRYHRNSFYKMSASVSRSVEEGSDSERLRYYTPTEVSSHNVSSDCWVSYLGKVYDLTPLCQDCSGESRK